MSRATPIRTVLVVVSDRAAAGTRPDATAALLRPVLATHGFALDEVVVVPEVVVSLVVAPEVVVPEATTVDESVSWVKT